MQKTYTLSALTLSEDLIPEAKTKMDHNGGIIHHPEILHSASLWDFK